MTLNQFRGIIHLSKRNGVNHETYFNLTNTGTAAFPIWTVWKETEDDEGFLLEELSEIKFRSPDPDLALKFIKDADPHERFVKNLWVLE